jgi:hypothetical protein
VAKNQLQGLNSVEKVVQLVGELSEKIPLPEGVVLRNEDEVIIWGQFTRARAREGWRDFDLLLVAKAVRLEADIRKHQQSLDRTGIIVKNDRGTPIPNPLISIVDSLQRQQLAIIRSLSLNQTAQDPRTLNGQGVEQNKFSKQFNSFDDLIAR